MQNSTYPPFLDLILDNCPEAGSLYTRFWRDKSFDNDLKYDKEKITNEYSIAWKKFKHCLRLLQKEKVLKFSLNATNDKVVVTLSEEANPNIIPFKSE